MTKTRGIFQRLKNRSQPPAAPASAASQNRAKIRADNPIRNAKDDTLGRAPTAQAFAKEMNSIAVKVS
jgi:hypothetical protein